MGTSTNIRKIGCTHAVAITVLVFVVGVRIFQHAARLPEANAVIRNVIFGDIRCSALRKVDTAIENLGQRAGNDIAMLPEV